MKLEAWLNKTGTPTEEFALRCDMGRSTMFRFKKGVRIPNRKQMSRIVAETGGEVTPNDFYGLETACPPEPEQVVA
jgi:hypothetical protein